MHRHEVVAAEELVQLDVVDVPMLPDLGRVQHREHVVVVDVDLGDVVAGDAVADGEIVKAEGLGQDLGVHPTTDRHVDPEHALVAREQLGELLGSTLLQARVIDQLHVHDHAPSTSSTRATPWSITAEGFAERAGFGRCVRCEADCRGQQWESALVAGPASCAGRGAAVVSAAVRRLGQPPGPWSFPGPGCWAGLGL